MLAQPKPQKFNSAFLAELSRIAERAIVSIDPFSVKRLSKVSAPRLLYTCAARYIEFEAKFNYSSYAITSRSRSESASLSIEPPAFLASQWANTRLTPEQMHHLLHHARLAFERLGGALVEVGSYRGVTTRALAEQTKATVYAVDPFALYGGDAKDFALFAANTSGCPHIVHVKKTSGDACNDFKPGAFCFVFIDATPGFVNVKYDATRWGTLLMDGGFVAINNVDNALFPGSRKAAWQMIAEGYDVFSCAHDICVLAKRSSA